MKNKVLRFVCDEIINEIKENYLEGLSEEERRKLLANAWNNWNNWKNWNNWVNYNNWRNWNNWRNG